MFQYPCDYDGCGAPTRYQQGDCDICRKHLCDEHLTLPVHQCLAAGADIAQIDRESLRAECAALRAVLTRLDLTGIAEVARPGYKVIKVPDLDPMQLQRGWRNTMVPIEFDDGEVWLARVRQGGFYAIPRLMGRVISEGEIGVLRYLTEVVDVSVPRVMSRLFTHGEADFYYMSRIPGVPSPLAVSGYQPGPNPQLSQTIKDLALFFVKISNHPLKGVGSLVQDDKGTWTAGPLIGGDPESSSPPYYPGPFSSAGEKWALEITKKLHAIKAGQIHATRRGAAMLTWSWIRDAVASYAPFNEPDQPTYVMHDEPKGDTLRVDGEGCLTGIIDWECASLAYKCEAFAAPIALLPNADLFNGSIALSPAEEELMAAYVELDRPDLAECVKNGKVFQRLWCLCSLEGVWAEHRQLECFALALGIEMPGTTIEEFLQIQKARYGSELA